jgi:F-type H+-transporting ATPase subunit gamma
MTRRRELDMHLRKLEEIGEIMRSMKNLALMETRKLARRLEAQARAVHLIETAAADFLAFHPRPAPVLAPRQKALLAIGSERGFCGDFNEELLAQIPDSPAPILAVGTKLHARLEHRPAVAALLEGPSVVEDTPKTIDRLAMEFHRLQTERGALGLSALHWREDAGIRRKTLIPPFADAAPDRPAHCHPPLLNLSPETFFEQLTEQYLYAALHEIFHASLMAENQRRIRHLEGAIQRLEEKTAELARRSRSLRQEEITEEIEVILLSAEEAKF